MTPKCGNTLQDHRLVVWFSRQSEPDRSFPISWFLFLLNRGPLFWGWCCLMPISFAPSYCSLQGQWLTGQKITDNFIWGMLFSSLQRKKEQKHTIPAAYTHTGSAYLQSTRTCSLSPHNQLYTAPRLCLLNWRSAFAAVPPLCPASTHSRRKGRSHSVLPA